MPLQKKHYQISEDTSVNLKIGIWILISAIIAATVWVTNTTSQLLDHSSRLVKIEENSEIIVRDIIEIKTMLGGHDGSRTKESADDKGSLPSVRVKSDASDSGHEDTPRDAAKDYRWIQELQTTIRTL